jgi:hypothetical protein
MSRLLVALALVAVPFPAIAAPLTVRTGETWLFRIDHGEPAQARKANPAAKPARGEVKVAVRSLFGTMMTISSNSAHGYSFKAELIGADGKAVAARACGLPPNNQPALESWPQKAAAVRIGAFKPASGGRC